jgi:hypothetical protein
MDKSWFCSFIWPNLLIISLSCIIAFPNFSHSLHILFTFTPFSLPFILTFIFCIFTFLMYLWSWLRAGLGDPGRVADDLQSRGLLQQIKRGDIPDCLRSLPICAQCGLPFPNGASHCKICHSCVLRHDHHCCVVGNCIGDKNFKSFILAFFYAAVFGLANAGLTWFVVSDVLNEPSEMLCVFSGFMSGFMGISLLIMGIGFFSDEACEERKSVYRPGTLIQSFGKSWWLIVAKPE